MKKTILSILLPVVVLVLSCFILTGCRSSETVSYNLSKEADEFKVRRRITFINLRTGEYLFTMSGLCALQGGQGDLNNELEVICKIGDGQYQKHFLFLASETTYVVEQLETNDVSRYDYEFIFRPEAIIPIDIKVQTGEN